MSGRVRWCQAINYRGDDSQTAAALIDNHLTDRFGSDQVFLDSRSIPAGTDFVEELLGRLPDCNVLLVVIGPHWLTLTSQDGQRRIDDSDDWIRREIAEALARGLRVVPVLTDGATAPLSKLWFLGRNDLTRFGAGALFAG